MFQMIVLTMTATAMRIRRRTPRSSIGTIVPRGGRRNAHCRESVT
jgi:hypothetical protein